MRKASILFVAIALAVFGLAACGGDGNDEDTTAETTATEETTAGGSGGAGGTVNLSAPADGTFAYDQTSAEAKAGSVTINFDNPATLSHDVVIEDDSATELGKTDLISQSSTSTAVELTPGTYTFFCDVPGHREGGMEGTLTVN